MKKTISRRRFNKSMGFALAAAASSAFGAAASQNLRIGYSTLAWNVTRGEREEIIMEFVVHMEVGRIEGGEAREEKSSCKSKRRRAAAS
jgi:hypothetical protein